MPLQNEAALVGFDAGRAVSVAREATGDALAVAAEYTTDEYRLLYVADDVVELYGGPDEVDDVAASLHDYLHLDFAERTLFEDLFPPVEETRAQVTHTDHAIIARVFAPDDEGLYLSFRPGTEVSAVVDEVAEILRK